MCSVWGKCLLLLWPSQLGGSWRKHGSALNLSTHYSWFIPLSAPWSLCQSEMIRGSTGHFHVRSLLLLPSPRKQVIYLVSPAFHKKCFAVSVDVDLFCWAYQVYYRVVEAMFSSLCHVDLYKEYVLRTLLGEVAMPMLSAVTDTILVVLRVLFYFSFPCLTVILALIQPCFLSILPVATGQI